MKLLFDANLSPKLVRRLAELLPGSVHVFDTGLARFTSDEVIWDYAGAKGFMIITADSDFLSLAAVRGAPQRSSALIIATTEPPRLKSFFGAMQF